MIKKMQESENITKLQTLSIGGKLAAYLELTKPRIALMLVLTSAAGFYLGSQTFDWILFINAMLATTLLAFGVATLNQYIERDIDKLMTRTENRPLPSGRLSPIEALIFGSVLCVVSEIYLYFAVNPLTALLGFAVIVGYVFLYTPLKTRTSLSTAIGAIPGALPPLLGFTAAANEITIGAWITFAILFVWQFPHFLAIAWMYRDQYAKAGILMLPVIEPEGRITARQIVAFAVILLPISISAYFVNLAGVIYLVGAIILGLWFLYESIKMARLKTDQQARKLLRVSIIYLPLIYLLLALNH
jgi:heme o synthase